MRTGGKARTAERERGRIAMLLVGVVALGAGACGGSALSGEAADEVSDTSSDGAEPPLDTVHDALESDETAPEVTPGDATHPPDTPSDADDTGPDDAGLEGDAEVEGDTGRGPCHDLPDGTPCEDAAACTASAECRGGRCIATAARSCDDGNPCTDDRCDPTVGCVQTPNVASCDDGDPCTLSDFCRLGACIGGGPACDDGNPCTRDACAPDGACVNTADDTLLCDDGSDCTGGDFCSMGICVAGPLDGCDRDDPCRVAACSSDGLTCEEADTDGLACDDRNACTSGDLCLGGACQSGGPLDCGWDAGCADFSCDAVDGCRLDALRIAGTPCEDGDRCTEGTSCDAAGRCIGGAAVICDDNNTCTDNECVPSTGCVYITRSGLPCDDDNACTTDDTCLGSSCRGTAYSCDDGDPCTLDRCDPRTGCTHAPVVCDGRGPCEVGRCGEGGVCVFEPAVGPCNDGRACTTGDACVMGVCVGLDVCDDGDPCTTDVCDAEEGCVHVPFEGACDDGDPCTIDEVCGGDGLCDGGVALPVIDDGLACTDDLCTSDPAGRHVAVPQRCGDGEACSLDSGCVDAGGVTTLRIVALDDGAWFALLSIVDDAALDLEGASIDMSVAGAEASITGGDTAGPGGATALAPPGVDAQALEAAAGEELDAILFLDTALPALTAGEVVTLSSRGGREITSATAP